MIRYSSITHLDASAPFNEMSTPEDIVLQLLNVDADVQVLWRSIIISAKVPRHLLVRVGISGYSFYPFAYSANISQYVLDLFDTSRHRQPGWNLKRLRTTHIFQTNHSPGLLMPTSSLYLTVWNCWSWLRQQHHCRKVGATWDWNCPCVYWKMI